MSGTGPSGGSSREMPKQIPEGCHSPFGLGSHKAPALEDGCSEPVKPVAQILDHWKGSRYRPRFRPKVGVGFGNRLVKLIDVIGVGRGQDRPSVPETMGFFPKNEGAGTT